MKEGAKRILSQVISDGLKDIKVSTSKRKRGKTSVLCDVRVGASTIQVKINVPTK